VTLSKWRHIFGPACCWEHSCKSSVLWALVCARRILICRRHLNLIPVFLIPLSYLKQHPYCCFPEIGFHFCTKKKRFYLIYCFLDPPLRKSFSFYVGLNFIESKFCLTHSQRTNLYIFRMLKTQVSSDMTW
jgi:hypothetical protein